MYVHRKEGKRMSLVPVNKNLNGDEYYTPDYVVKAILPYIKKDRSIKKVWCPFDKEYSEFVKILKGEGYEVVNTHIDYGQDFLTYEPDFEFDLIISNPPFSIKNEVFEKTISYGKKWALLMSATSVQSASFIKVLSKEKQLNNVMFDKRISYTGERPPFPSWFFTGGLLTKTEFYIYKDKPQDLYDKWVLNGGITKEEKEIVYQDKLF